MKFITDFLSDFADTIGQLISDIWTTYSSLAAGVIIILGIIKAYEIITKLK